MVDAREGLARDIYRAAHVTGSFRLRSGLSASEYFDKYRFEAEPALLARIVDMLVPLVPSGIDALAGLELGGIPIATLLAQRLAIPARFVRKRAKDYGTCLLAEGGELSGLRLLIVEDVITTGGQILESTRELRAAGASVEHALVVIDREQGGRGNLAREGLALHALFSRGELERAGGRS